MHELALKLALFKS